jgi:hypothetical protein
MTHPPYEKAKENVQAAEPNSQNQNLQILRQYKRQQAQANEQTTHDTDGASCTGARGNQGASVQQ